MPCTPSSVVHLTVAVRFKIPQGRAVSLAAGSTPLVSDMLYRYHYDTMCLSLVGDPEISPNPILAILAISMCPKIA